jgi:hypothetical protein
MIQKVFKWLNQPLGRVAVLIVALAVLSGVSWGISYAQQPPAQPIDFPHQRHAANGVQCVYCHPGSLHGPNSGLPTASKCWGCHQQLSITKTSVLLGPLRDAVASGKPILWVPVAQVPDFVQFNHRPHVASGLNCENCHGDVGTLTHAYENPQVMNMGWCLNCHREKAANDPVLMAKLTDCATCHY